jgi:hypothetical protein
MTIETQKPAIARSGAGSMLEIYFTCGWHGSGETKQELLEKLKAHVLEHDAEAFHEGVLRHLIAGHARPVGEREPSGAGPQRGGTR